MSITLVTGVPGSGKSYYAMDVIARLLESKDKFIIISNIDGTDTNIFDRRYVYVEFSMPMLRNESMCDYLAKLREEHGLDSKNMVYMFIDEAQKYYGADCKDKDQFFFLDYHRHYGIDIYLITQKDTKIRKEAEALCETEIRGVPPSLGILPGYFIYNHKCGGEVFDKIRLKKRQSVFDLYRSFNAGKITKAKYGMYVRIAVPLVLAIAAGFYSYHVLHHNYGASPAQAKEVVNNESKPGNDKQSNAVTGSVAVSKVDDKPAPKVRKRFDELEAPLLEFFDILSYKDYTITFKDKFDNRILIMNFWDFINKFPPSPIRYSYIASKDVLMISVDNGNRFLEFREDVPKVGVSHDPTITTVGSKSRS